MTQTGTTSLYLDHNASSIVAHECIEVMLQSLRSGVGNPSSLHTPGARASRLIEDARGKVADLMGAMPREIVFTCSGTEANHAAILGILAQRVGPRQVVTSAVEHPSTLMLLRHLEKSGVRVSYCPVDGQGRLSVEAVMNAISSDTVLVTVMWANNETGVLFPIAEIVALAHARGVIVHTDAVQAAGKIPIDLGRVPVDLLSLSSHKLYAPPGSGALFVRKGLQITPLLWGHQERRLRGGTPNGPAIVAFGRACALVKEGLDRDSARMRALRDRLERGIMALCPHAYVHGRDAPRLPNTSNIGFAGLQGEELQDAFNKNGVAVSTGAACVAGGMEPSHVLMAMGLGRRQALSAIRFSFGRYNTEADVTVVLEILPDILREVASRRHGSAERGLGFS